MNFDFAVPLRQEFSFTVFCQLYETFNSTVVIRRRKHDLKYDLNVLNRNTCCLSERSTCHKFWKIIQFWTLSPTNVRKVNTMTVSVVRKQILIWRFKSFALVNLSRNFLFNLLNSYFGLQNELNDRGREKLLRFWDLKKI